MEIDIIDYTGEQLALLTEAQLQEVKEAQVKKNRLLRELAEKLQQEKRRLINNGLFLSYTWSWTKAYWEKAYEEEIGWLKDGLLFFLQYKPGVKEEAGAHYPLDYSLTVLERAAAVKAYYLDTYADPKERFEAYKADTDAPVYLCNAYKSLWDYFYELAEE